MSNPQQLELPFEDGGIDWRCPIGRFMMHGILKMAMGREPTEAEMLAAIEDAEADDRQRRAKTRGYPGG